MDAQKADGQRATETQKHFADYLYDRIPGPHDSVSDATAGVPQYFLKSKSRKIA
jgi:hypothetical protein